MVRRGLRLDGPSFREVFLIPGPHEKGDLNDPPCPYLEPTLVPLGEKPKASGG